MRGRDLAGEGVDVLLTDAAASCGGARDYLGASVAHMVTDALLVAVLPAVLLEQRLPVLSIDTLAFRRHHCEPWLDRVWLGSARTWLLSTDPAAGHPDAVVVSSVHELRNLLADQLAALLAPVFGAIRQRAPFGVIGMWGQLVDGLYSLALWLAHQSGADQRAAWDEAGAVVDALAERVHQVRVRPRLFPVRTGAEERLFPVRGTCCLWYKSQTDDEPATAFCTTCPLREDADRTERLVRHLGSQAT